MKKEIVILIVITSILVLALSFLNKNKQDKIAPKILKIGGITLNIEVANTDAERVQGLSGRSGLSENGGMLFVFDNEGYYGFWMKDMNFPIDMAWLDKNKQIINIESNISPATYPQVFNPPAPSLYVLEVSAGFLSKNNIKIGDFVAF